MNPKLVLIGAGPGAEDLITLRALTFLQNAKVVLYDALVNPKILNIVPKNALKINVGKRGGKESNEQEKINQLIVSYSLIYGEVIRLKGGDPFIFGRGLEEIFFAKKHGLEVAVVPGISSATGLTALQQISLTHRGVADGFWVLTAAKKENEFNRDISLAAKSNSTIVILMGVKKIKEIVAAFIQANRKKTPVLVIQNGSLVNEKIWVTDIDSLLSKAHEENLEAPAIIVIGEVVEVNKFVLETKVTQAVLN